MAATRSKAAVAKAAAARFQTLVEIMQALRAPGGCPWDRKQTYASLRPFVLEETYEVLEAIDRGDIDALAGELGDFLFEAVFLAQIAADEGRFTIADAIDAINAKLIRRHPHVFGEEAAAAAMTGATRATRGRRARAPKASASTIRTAGKVLEQWEQIKAREQKQAGEQQSLLRGVPRALPSLLRSHEIGTRVASVGFEWPTPADVVLKIEEEVRELREAIDKGDRRHAHEEMGDLLFSIANLARKLGIEPESALREANEKFTRRFQALERQFEEDRRPLSRATLEEMEDVWRTVKTKDGRLKTKERNAKAKDRSNPARANRQRPARRAPKRRVAP
ncbi:MAG TPA: nucleoside triphosphate pyrophosphohydrolase [Vicinamibacterales bacterium]|nr:nucleoside triphosphate pyrophosphohydrolase [Vicinamibacterales bacterium]